MFFVIKDVKTHFYLASSYSGTVCWENSPSRARQFQNISKISEDLCEFELVELEGRDFIVETVITL